MDNKKLFVGGISWNLTEEELKEAFAKVGEVEEAKIITDRVSGRSKGFGFVTMATAEDAVKAVEEMNVDCWVTGLRCTEGRTRTDYEEVEERDEGLIKLNPILIWKEREVWQYLAVYGVRVNSLYAEGYRSLGCAPCTKITSDDNERAGRWIGTSKCGGECGIHTRPLKQNQGGAGI